MKKLLICLVMLTACGVTAADYGNTPIESIISIGPSNTEILVGLGFGDMIIQTDMHSYDVPGIDTEIANLDMMALNLEQIIDLAPDIVFATDIAMLVGSNDPLKAVSAAGIRVVYMDTSNSIEAIQEDILFIASVLGADARGEEIVAEMDSEIERIRAIPSGGTGPSGGRKTVYFEISPAPHMFSAGSGTFLNEMIEIAGGENIFADQEGWVSASSESLLELNPDIILTSVDFLDDPVSEILGRPGWNAITAVQNVDVFVINAAASNRPSHNIITALREISEAIGGE